MTVSATKITNKNQLIYVLKRDCIFRHHHEYENSFLDPGYARKQPLKILAIKYLSKILRFTLLEATTIIMRITTLFIRTTQ